jgi:hypothetical protein|tara:strand:- start:960 stop:1214 length:255 start_codon:yes stop_codon:yes gene_type:complete
MMTEPTLRYTKRDDTLPITVVDWAAICRDLGAMIDEVGRHQLVHDLDERTMQTALLTSLVQALAIADSFNTALTENPTDAGVTL